MYHITSRSAEKSKATPKPQPAQRYHHPDADQADEMEVDTLVTPKANSAPTANSAPATQQKSPTTQSAPGGISKALPPGLNFSRAVTAGTKRGREAEEPDATPPKRLEMDANPQGPGPSSSATPSLQPPPAAVSTTIATASATPATAAEPIAPGPGNNADNIIYHQVGQPHLTGPNPIPPPGIAVAPPLQPLHPIDEFYPPAKYELVPRPEGGFPDIKGQTYKTIRAHLDATTLRLWEKQTGPGVIAFSPADNGTIDTAKVILFRDMLRDSIHAPNLFIIAPDITHNKYTEHKPVTPYYIGGITEFQRDLLLRWNCWANPQMVFFIVPKGRFISNFLMTLENTFLDDSDASIAMVTSALMTTVMADAHHIFEDFVDEHHDAAGSHWTTEDILNTIVNGMEVDPLQITEKGASITLFNIYAASPTKDGDAHDQWISLFRSRTYEFYGTANAKHPYTCGTCSGQDHPTGKCPYHDLPGWHKTPAKTSKYDKPINMNRGQGQREWGSTSYGGARGGHGGGNRGRGGGRGGQTRGRSRGRDGRS